LASYHLDLLVKGSAVYTEGAQGSSKGTVFYIDIKILNLHLFSQEVEILFISDFYYCAGGTL
jgi:hypothetical protein